MGVASVSIYSEADAGALHAGAGDEAISIGGMTAAESYLDLDLVFEAAYRTGADAIHPGYGFLAENADFAARCEAAGIAFVGPTAGADARCSASSTRRASWRPRRGCRCCRAPGCWPTSTQAKRAAKRIGYPVMLKSTAGGGGIGMRRCADGKELAAAFDAVARLGKTHFKQAGSLHREAGRSRAPRRGADLRRRRRRGAGAGRSATARCSGATRRSSRRRRRPACPRRTRAAMDDAAVRLGTAAQLPVGRHRRVRRRGGDAGRSTSSR